MSERNGYEPGVPMWVDTWRDDAVPAARFYGELFGWELAGIDEDGPDRYVIGQLRGRDVAAIGSPRPELAPASPAWITHVWVADADETAAAVRAAGGDVLGEPFDSMDGGRMAIVADPQGATLACWAPGEHQGAEVVNEPGAWAMSSLATTDLTGAQEFYGQVFGWQADDFPGGALFRLPGFFGGEPTQPVPRDVVAVGFDAPPDREHASWEVNFWVSDIENVVQRIAPLGGTVIAPPAPVPGAPMVEAVIADPEGATMSVSELRLAEAGS